MRNKNIKDNWDNMSLAYESFTSGKDSYSFAIEWPAIKQLMPNIENKKVLDLGCGTGRFGFIFEKYSPSEIVGVDISEGMLNIARKAISEKNSKMVLHQCDIQEFCKSEKKQYDFIFSSTTLHYIENLSNLFENINKILTDDGSCIISVIHPVYSAHYPIADGDKFPLDEDWKIQYLNKYVRAYIQPWIEYNNEVENFTSKSYHHTFSDYFNAAKRNQLIINEIIEPSPPEEWKEKFGDKYIANINKPTFMIFNMSRR